MGAMGIVLMILVTLGLFLTILIVSVLTLGAIAYFHERRNDDGKNAPLTLLPGDVKYQSPSGSFQFYFPIMTSIVLSIVLTLVLRILF